MGELYSPGPSDTLFLEFLDPFLNGGTAPDPRGGGQIPRFFRVKPPLGGMPPCRSCGGVKSDLASGVLR